MKVLYGVQGTGNGHLSRARAMAAAFQDSALEVDYLFSGRAPERFFDMECFGEFRVRPGMTFVSIDGRVNYLRTVLGNNYWQFLRDVFSLDVSAYDLIITDFEPITAWAGRLRGKTVISMGHQPAFDHPVPVADRDVCASLVMALFAPGSVRVGMHWDKYGAPLLPPLLYERRHTRTAREGKVVVYLPFESQSRVHDVLLRLREYEFFVYAPGSTYQTVANLHLRPTSLQGFQADLEDCTAVICNAGFELSSECLSLGKRLLVKPQGRQMEQASNALALRQLGYAATMDELDVHTIRYGLARKVSAPQITFPDVARAITRWLETGDFSDRSLATLSDRLWREVRVDGRAVWPRTGAADSIAHAPGGSLVEQNPLRNSGANTQPN